ncbi:rhombosortase [Alteromonas pelagimontana]|uniref:Rhombosortase n=1 Tax=Alteromonas pelagimontana TaxID=1858656 RepID=A0A6M4MJ64_9ALTE|nr:rhombosortase [Alteromonas pelagimontana]QJR82685.1 rhombosortase [Alteromonas pelagimontana]
MIALPLAPRYSIGPLIVAVLSILAFFCEPRSSDYLAYDRYAIEGFETWRLITGNLVHTNGYHLVMNIAGLLLLWALHGEHYRPVRYIKLFFWCCLGTSIGIYWFSANLIWYVGLSGALHGIFIWGACMDIRQGMKSGWLLLIGVSGKVLYEQLTGGSTEVAALIDANVAIDAHLYGAVSGLLLFTAMVMLSRPRH